MPDDVRIRPMTVADLPAAMALKEAAGWNQTEQDWRLLLRLQPDGCFVLETGERVAASATAYCYGKRLAWIGMVLTLPEFRGRGFGNRVFLEAVEFCRLRGIHTIKLDATDMGRPLYERAGFRGEYDVERWGTAAATPPRSSLKVGAMPAQEDLHVLLGEDTAAFGVPRPDLLRALVETTEWFRRGPESYALGRPGAKALYFGPCVARFPDEAAALLASFLEDYAGRPVFVDVPAPNRTARQLLRANGFEVRRTLVRMSLGPNDHPGDPSRVFGLAGFEYG